MTAGWPRAKLGDVVEIKHGFAFSGMSENADSGLPVVVGIGNFDYAGGFRFGSTTVKRFVGDYPPEFTLAPGDILLAMTCQTAGGEILGIPGTVPDDGQTYLHNQRIGKVEVLDPGRIDLNFVFQLARWQPFNYHLFATASGSKILHTSPGRIEDFAFDLPPLDEQRAIAATLGVLDDKIESNRRAIGAARSLMRSYYDAATKQSVIASEVLTPVLGGTPKRGVLDYWDGGVKWASAKDVASAEGGFVLDTAETISEEGVQRSAAKIMPAGTIVMTARGTVGALARLSEPMTFNQSCYGLRTREGREASLLVALEAAVAHIKDSGHGTVFNTVNMATFDQIELEVPSSADLDVILAGLSDVVLQRLNENRRLSVLRDALLPGLLSGRIRIFSEVGA